MNEKDRLHIYCPDCRAGNCTAQHQALIAWLRSEALANQDEHEKAKRNREAARARALAFDRKRHGLAQSRKAPLPHSGPLETMQAKLRDALLKLAEKECAKDWRARS